MLAILRAASTLLLALILNTACCSHCPPVSRPPHGWPIEPTGMGHPLGHALGDFQRENGVYQHAGIDILATPHVSTNPADSAPWVVATVGGTISCKNYGVDNVSNFCEIKGVDGIVYRYYHLYLENSDPNSINSSNNSGKVSPGDHIAQVITWTDDANFSHLHYELECRDKYLNPLPDITPHVDNEWPTIVSVGFAKDKTAPNDTTPWQEFSATIQDLSLAQQQIAVGPTCPATSRVVSGAVDIVVQLYDHDTAGSQIDCHKKSTIGIHHLRWKVCPSQTPDCTTWNSIYQFDDMPTEWFAHRDNDSSRAQFSTNSSWISEFNYCTENPAFMVVTDFQNGKPSAAGNWDTTALPDGHYVVRVEVTDFGGNVTTHDEDICVSNQTN